MKIEFSGDTQVQQSVRPAQDRINKARPSRVPILRILITLLIFGALGYGVWRFYHMQSVYTYGLVSSQVESIHAPQDGTVKDVNVSRGRSVNVGDAMMTIDPVVTSDTAEAQERVLEEIKKSDSVRIERQKLTIEMAEKEVERLSKQLTEEDMKRKTDYELAQLETLKLKEFQGQKQKRLAKLKKLFELDAAIQSDIDSAENEVQLAKRNYQQAVVAEKLAKSRALPSESALKMAQYQLESIRKSPTTSSADLEQAKFQLDLSKNKLEPIIISSLFNGLVLELDVVNGSTVRAGQEIASVIQTDEVWVDVYIPSRQYDLLQEGEEAEIFIPGSADPIIGIVSEKLGAVVRPPEILRDDLPRETTTLYARIDLPEGTDLLPGLEVRVIID